MSGPNYRPIITSFEGPVATIVFNRPEVHNAMDAAAIHAFRAAVDALEFAEPVAVVLHGADGSPFGTGGDLRELADVTDRDEITDLFNAPFIFFTTAVQLQLDRRSAHSRKAVVMRGLGKRLNGCTQF